MRFIALLLILFQEGDLEPYLKKLRTGGIEERERAVRDLERLGPGIAPRLHAAISNEDAEVVIRIRHIVAEIERLEADRKSDADRRAALLKPVPESERQGSNWSRIEGARFDFSLKNRVLRTTVRADAEISIEFNIEIQDEDGKPLPVERCGKCSPRIVRIAQDSPIRPVLRGVRRWSNPRPVVFSSPVAGQVRKIGDFTIEVDWPELIVTSKTAIRWDVLVSACPGFEVDYKDDLELDQGRYSTRCFRNRPDTRPPTWCDCPGGPTPVVSPNVEAIHKWRVSQAPLEEPVIFDPARQPEVDDIAQIRFTFKKPVEETFELKGPLLKP